MLPNTCPVELIPAVFVTSSPLGFDHLFGITTCTQGACYEKAVRKPFYEHLAYVVDAMVRSQLDLLSAYVWL